MEKLQIIFTVNYGASKYRKLQSLIFCLVILFLSGCVTQSKKSISPVIEESAKIFQNGNFAVYEIPSHGAIGDSLSISAKGGQYAGNLSAAFAALSKSDNGNIVVYSANPDLSYTVINGAIADKQFPTVWLVYAGSSSNSKLLSPLAKQSSMKYSFIDIVDREPE